MNQDDADKAWLKAQADHPALAAADSPRMSEVYIIREHDSTAISAPPRILGVALSKEAADRLVAEWDPQQHWSSLSAMRANILGVARDGEAALRAQEARSAAVEDGTY